MITATATRPVRDVRPEATTSIAVSDLRHTMRLALVATDSLSHDDPVWIELVPYMDELDQVLGQAIGRASSPSPESAAPILRIRALAVAARHLLRGDVTVVNGAAAARAAELAGVLARAGVTGVVSGTR